MMLDHDFLIDMTPVKQKENKMKSAFRIAVVIALSFVIASAVYAGSGEWTQKTKERAKLVQLRNLLDKQLCAMQELENGYDLAGWTSSDYSLIVNDTHRLYIDCEVAAAKLGAKPLHPEIIEVRQGELYASQIRHSQE